MFRKMRRSKQEMAFDDCVKVLENGTSGVLALSGDDDYPYAMPISYLYHDDKLYFHCAKSGHKLDAIKRNSKASFCVIGQDNILPEKFTTCYISVIAFGKMRIIDNEEEKMQAIKILTSKYCPLEDEEKATDEIEKYWNALCMLELDIEHMTGKRCIELVNGTE